MRRSVFFILAVCLLPALAGVRVGVLYFDVAAPDNSYNYLATGIPEMLMTDLANQPDMTVVEREKLDRVLQEHALSGSGLTVPEQAVELGRILDLDLMVLGNLTVVAESMRLDVKIVFVESGEVAAGVRAEAEDTRDVFEMTDIVSEQLIERIRTLRYGSSTTPVMFVDPSSGAPRVDVAFVVDTTGSMGDEIEVVKQKMREIAVEVAKGDPAPAVRFAIVEYRDRGDEYVTRVTDFTYDVIGLHEVINRIYATGGGDTQESVFPALNDALNDLSWDDQSGMTRLVFLIGDAGPHPYPDEYYLAEDAIEDATDRGISIFAIGCSGLDEDYGATDAFKRVAYGTNGSFEYLSYRKTYQDATGAVASYIYEGDRMYDEEAVREELADSGVVGEDTDVFDIGVTRATKAAEGVEAGEVDFHTEAGRSGGAVGSVTAAPSSLSDSTLAAADDRAGEMAYTGTVSGYEISSENNLDSLVTQVIQSNVAKQGVRYDMGVTQARVLIRQGDQEIWVPVSDPTQVERLQEAADNGETLWLAAGIKTDDEGKLAFRAGTLSVYDDAEAAPAMTQRSLTDLESDTDYYINNGMGADNQWSFEAQIVDFEME